MKIKMKLFVGLVSVFALLLFAGCADPKDDASTVEAGSSKDVIKIGVPTPLSAPGDYKSGEINVNTLKLAQEELNDAGGVLNKKVELVIADDEGNVSKGVSVVKNMIQKDKVSAILGVWAGSIAQAQSIIADESKTPIMFHYSWPDEITAQHSEYVFRVSPYNSQIVKLLVPFIKEKGYKHVAVMGEDTEYGIGFSNAMKAAGEEEGFDVTITTFSSEAVDFSPELLKLKNMENVPELTIVASIFRPMYLIPKQAHEVGLTEVTQMMAGWDYPVSSDEYWDTNGEAGVNILYPSFYSDELTLSDAGKKFRENYKAKFNENPPIYAYYLYDSFQMVIEAIKKADSSDPEKIAEALKDLEFEGTTGQIVFERDEEDPTSPVWNQWLGHQIFINQLKEVGDMGEDAELIWSK